MDTFQKIFEFGCADDELLEIEDLGEFYRDNDLDPETVNAIGRMEVGAEMLFGGGAAPLSILRRVS